MNNLVLQLQTPPFATEGDKTTPVFAGEWGATGGDGKWGLGEVRGLSPWPQFCHIQTLSR